MKNQRNNSLTQKNRPRSSITKRTIDIYAESMPLSRRIKQAYNIDSGRNRPQRLANQNKCTIRDIINTKIDSDQPQSVYNWLDQFQNSISKKSVGIASEYSLMKYKQSINLIDSKGYKTVKEMQKYQFIPTTIKATREGFRKKNWNDTENSLPRETTKN